MITSNKKAIIKNTIPILFNIDVWNNAIPSKDIPARIRIVIKDSNQIMELRDNPIAGIDVKVEENLDKKQIIQIIAQLMT